MENKNEASNEAAVSNGDYSQKTSKKLLKLKGDAYEKIASFNIIQKVYFEDIKNLQKNINNNVSINPIIMIDELRNEILNNLFPDYKITLQKEKFIQVQNQIYECFIKFFKENDIYKNNYVSSMSSSESESDKKKSKNIIKNNYKNEKQETNVNNESKKTIKKIEMDLAIKEIKGNIILNYLKRMGNSSVQYLKSFEIEENKKYNIVFEITINSEDFFKIKIPQLFKYASSLDLLYSASSIIYKEAKSFIQQFNQKYGFLNYNDNTIIICVSDNNKEDFMNLKANFEKLKENVLLSEFKNICLGKYNVYFNYYPYFIDNETRIEEELKKKERFFLSKLNEKEEDIKRAKDEFLKKLNEKDENLRKAKDEFRKTKDEFIQRLDEFIKNSQKKENELLQKISQLEKQIKKNE